MQLPGADELEEEEEEEEEENDDDTILEELDECIVAGGKTSEEIKQMTAREKNEQLSTRSCVTRTAASRPRTSAALPRRWAAPR